MARSMLHGDGELAVAGEGGAPAEHLVEDDAERVDVGASVLGLALDLLGREILGGAEIAPVLRRSAPEPVAVEAALAMPKSATSTRPSSASRMLAGLTSRWTMPAAWA